MGIDALLVRGRVEAHVLVVGHIGDDEQILVGRLRASGYVTSVAAEGREGLALAEKRIVDVVVMSTELPDIKALRLTAQFRRLNPNVAILLVAEGAGQKEVAKWLDGGIDDCVTDGRSLVELLARRPAIVASTNDNCWR